MRTVSIGIVIISIDSLLENLEDWIVSCFTPAELDYSMGFRNPLYPLGARFCAKRMFQLWGSAEEDPLRRLNEVEVLGTHFGPPQVCLRGNALRLAATRGVTAMHLSLSHCQDYAGALLVVTTERDGETGCDGSSSPV